MKSKFSTKASTLILSLTAGILFSAAPVRAQDAPPNASVAPEELSTNPPQDQISVQQQVSVTDNNGNSTKAVTEMAPDDSNDPPTRVARLSIVDGSVSMQPGGVGAGEG